MKAIIDAINKSPNKIVIKITSHNQDDTTLQKGGKIVIRWDPHSGVITNSGRAQSPALGLGHELDHALRAAMDPNGFKHDRQPDNSRYSNAEEKRVITGSERSAARTLHEGVRDSHSFRDLIYELDPTSH